MGALRAMRVIDGEVHGLAWSNKVAPADGSSNLRFRGRLGEGEGVEEVAIETQFTQLEISVARIRAALVAT